MTKYYSPSVGGFYDTSDTVDRVYPDDMIELSDSEYFALLEANAKHGKEIYAENGQVLTRDFVPFVNWDSVRRKRNRLLEKSDYTQMPDYPGNKMLWSEYRQLLRDIPQTYSSPEEVIWPVAPGN